MTSILDMKTSLLLVFILFLGMTTVVVGLNFHNGAHTVNPILVFWFGVLCGAIAYQQSYLEVRMSILLLWVMVTAAVIVYEFGSYSVQTNVGVWYLVLAGLPVLFVIQVYAGTMMRVVSLVLTLEMLNFIVLASLTNAAPTTGGTNTAISVFTWVSLFFNLSLLFGISLSCTGLFSPHAVLFYSSIAVLAVALKAGAMPFGEWVILFYSELPSTHLVIYVVLAYLPTLMLLVQIAELTSGLTIGGESIQSALV